MRSLASFQYALSNLPSTLLFAHDRASTLSIGLTMEQVSLFER
jgi:hypothetical protein